MPSTRRQKSKARRSREMDMMSNFDNLDVMLGNENNNPIERELTDVQNNPQPTRTQILTCTVEMSTETLHMNMIL